MLEIYNNISVIYGWGINLNAIRKGDEPLGYFSPVDTTHINGLTYLVPVKDTVMPLDFDFSDVDDGTEVEIYVNSVYETNTSGVGAGVWGSLYTVNLGANQLAEVDIVNECNTNQAQSRTWGQLFS